MQERKLFGKFRHAAKLSLAAAAAAVMLAGAGCDPAVVKPEKPSNRAEGGKDGAGRGRIPAVAGKDNGLMLDIARHFYSVRVIKKFIDSVADSGGRFVHLHLSDDENYALESAILGQTAQNALISDGIYTNPHTGKPFLSDAQLGEIVRYAHSRNVELIPEVDSPAHMAAVFRLLEQYRGKAYAHSLKSNGADAEIDMDKPESIAFVESLIGEVSGKFKYGKRFHIGGDEFGYSRDSNSEFVRYANRLAGFVQSKGLRAQMWNDGIIKPTMKKLNHNIQITYWSYDGDTENPTAKKYRRKLRASMPELINEGFSVLNYNSYYLYFIPNEDLPRSGDGKFAAEDVRKNWHLGVWDGDNHQNAIRNPDKVQGAAVAIWGEDAPALSGEAIFEHTQDLLRAVMTKANKASAEKQ